MEMFNRIMATVMLLLFVITVLFYTYTNHKLLLEREQLLKFIGEQNVKIAFYEVQIKILKNK